MVENGIVYEYVDLFDGSIIIYGDISRIYLGFERPLENDNNDDIKVDNIILNFKKHLKEIDIIELEYYAE